jgi:acyl-coenzyme A synthetase/AMP-(fatty) acid ligase
VSDAALPVEELQRFCADHLGVRAPRLFLRVDEIPRNAMGKVVRRQVAELAMSMLRKTRQG